MNNQCNPYIVDVNVGCKEVPDGGAPGQVLQKLDLGYDWQDYLKVYAKRKDLPLYGALDNVLYYVAEKNTLYRYNGADYEAIDNSDINQYYFKKNSETGGLDFVKNNESGTEQIVYNIKLSDLDVNATATEVNALQDIRSNVQAQIDAQSFPAYPTESQLPHTLMAYYENGSWVRVWEPVSDPSSSLVGIGRVGFMEVQ